MSHPKTAEIKLNGQPKRDIRDTEVVPKAKRRQFSVAYKKRILSEVDDCTEAGQIGAILRREGLYSSHLSTWRRQRERGELASALSGSRGRPVRPEAEQEVTRLRQENERLQQRLAQAEAIIDVQKKVSQLIGLTLTSSQPDEAK
jgi:transposase-like protein